MVSESVAAKIGRITPSGTITHFALPNKNSNPQGITSGPDGALWFTESSKIGRISTTGVIQEFNGASGSSNIVVGADGNLWFTGSSEDTIGRITPSGEVTKYPLAPNSLPTGITSGPDGALWFTEQITNRIGRITTDGSLSVFPVPTDGGGPTGITKGPDGNLWFLEAAANKVARMTPAGAVTEYPIPIQRAKLSTSSSDSTATSGSPKETPS